MPADYGRAGPMESATDCTGDGRAARVVAGMPGRPGIRKPALPDARRMQPVTVARALARAAAGGGAARERRRAVH